ncbi:MAG: Gfo/Idh/MocA family oxidoreductase [Actinomycetota bacterium]|jgi:predicted dehydrogenase|nr:Gfo/Idh/MocA family oxidoreductase [Actinomycetota bacterium]
MSQASKRVVATGFAAHPRAAALVQNSLSGSIEFEFLEPPLDREMLFDLQALLIGPAFDFKSDLHIAGINDASQKGVNVVVLGPPSGSDSPAWQKLTGAKAAATKPAGEWFLKIQDFPPLTERLSSEFVAVGRLTVLELHDGTDALLTTSIAFRDHVTAAIRRLPSSSVCTFGFNPTSDHLSQDLEALIRRAVMTGANTKAGPSSLGVGIVGYGPFGGMGSYHAAAVSAVPGLHLVAVVDNDTQRRSAAAKEFPSVKAYQSADELALDDEVDICIVATPPVSHAELSIALLDAGKHVISEKPMCLTLREANRLIAKSKERDRMLSVNQNRRWDRDFRSVAKVVSDGKVGSLFNIETFVGGFEHPCRAWHSEESVSGGAVFDWGSHHVDQIIQLYGDAPAKVSASQHKRVWHDVTNVDQIRVHMLWEDGREAEFFQSDIAAIRKPKYFIQGTIGTIIGHYRPIIEETVTLPFGYEERELHYAEAPAELRLSRYESEQGLVEETLPLASQQRFAFHRNIANHLLLREPLAVTPESVAVVIATLEAAQLSSSTDSQYVKLSEVEC